MTDRPINLPRIGAAVPDERWAMRHRANVGSGVGMPSHHIIHEREPIDRIAWVIVFASLAGFGMLCGAILLMRGG